jgi:hypothetical protein
LEQVKLVAPALNARNIAHWITAGRDVSFVVRRKPSLEFLGAAGLQDRDAEFGLRNRSTDMVMDGRQLRPL